MKKFIYVCLFISSLIGFGQNSSNDNILSDKLKQEMITEFIRVTTEFEKQLDNNYQTVKKGSNNEVDTEKLRTTNINLKKIMDDKIKGIELKYNISKKYLYLYLSEYYKTRIK